MMKKSSLEILLIFHLMTKENFQVSNLNEPSVENEDIAFLVQPDIKVNVEKIKDLMHDRNLVFPSIPFWMRK